MMLFRWVLAISFSTLLFLGILHAEAVTAPEGMRLIPSGSFQPFLQQGKSSTEESSIQVAAFYIDTHPVTNSRILEFVLENPQWKPQQIPELFAEPSYLSQVTELDQLNDSEYANRPVVYISWYAARAYCEWREKRLPTLAEWEYVAGIGVREKEGRSEKGFREQILSWYSQPSSALPREIGTGSTNLYGVRDLYGLIWEWVEDFNSALVTNDNREGATLSEGMFCGGGSMGATDSSDYATFMRYAFRSSLQGHYTVKNLGFRCARTANSPN